MGKKKIRTIVGHGKDRNLRDGSVAALHTTGALVDSGKICVHVTWISAATWNFFSGGRDFSQSIAVGCQICEDDQDVLLQLVRIVFCGSKGETRGDDTFDGGIVGQV